MLRSFSILQFTRLSSCCLSFKGCLPFLLQQHKYISSTTSKTNSNIDHGTYPYTPFGTRASQQKNSRRLWTKEEDELLKKLYTEFGPQYTLITREFPGRIVSTVFKRCKFLFDPTDMGKLGPWQKDELDALRTLVEEATGSSQQLKSRAMINWQSIQRRLPYPRELNNIKMTWYHTINPQWQRGRWTPDETARFQHLVQQVGINDWRKVSALLGTRSARQCLEKYRHDIALTRKGPFTPEEDAGLVAAVNAFGDGDFLHIKQALQSQRTPRQLAKRYRFALDPSIDRSPWTMTEKLDVYRLALQFDRNMCKVKEHMNSKRHVSDMWNRFKVIVQSKAVAARKVEQGKKTRRNTKAE